MRVQSIDGTLAHYRGVMGQVHARQAQAMRPNEGPSEDDGEDEEKAETASEGTEAVPTKKKKKTLY